MATQRTVTATNAADRSCPQKSGANPGPLDSSVRRNDKVVESQNAGSMRTGNSQGLESAAYRDDR